MSTQRLSEERAQGRTHRFQVTFDAADPRTLCAFWCEALGYQRQPPPDGFADWDAALQAWGVPAEQRNDKDAALPVDGDGPRLFFQRVSEPKSAKNRVHLDIRAAEGVEAERRMSVLRAEALRLTELGASVVNEVTDDPFSPGFIVMSDPEGNEFCLD